MPGCHEKTGDDYVSNALLFIHFFHCIFFFFASDSLNWRHVAETCLKMRGPVEQRRSRLTEQTKTKSEKLLTTAAAAGAFETGDAFYSALASFWLSVEIIHNL